MNWDDVKKVFYCRKMLDGKIHFFVREERLPFRVRQLELEMSDDKDSEAEDLVRKMNAEIK